MAQWPKRRPSNPFSTINPHAAGIDIGATHHVVAVSPDRDPTAVRMFRTSVVTYTRSPTGCMPSASRPWQWNPQGVMDSRVRDP